MSLEVTRCSSCGRQLAPTYIAGTWECGSCFEARKTEEERMTEFPLEGTAPPPPAARREPPPEERRPPEEPQRPAPPPDEPQVAPPEVLEQLQAIVRPAEELPPSGAEGTGQVPGSRDVPAQPPPGGKELTGEVVERRPAQLPASRPASAPAREEPTWRELGHWLGLAEADDGSAACRQAGAAFRLYALAQMDLPLHAAQELTMLGGKLNMSAALLRLLARRGGYRIERVDATEQSCTAVLIHRRTGELIGQTTFTIAEAERAGLLRARSAWVTYPGRMLWARASAYVVRDFAPEVALGLQLSDEAEEEYALGAEPIGIDATVDPYDLRSEADDDIPF